VGSNAKKISSFGNLSFFRPENAPEGSTDRCLDCPCADTCRFDGKKAYLPIRGEWPATVLTKDQSEEGILKALREGPYGRCVYHCDNDVVDHQVVNLELEDGSTCNFTMTAFTAHGGRTIRIGGTMGEILADMKANTIRVMRYGEEDEVIDVRKLADDFSGHAGGDAVLVREFIDLVRGEIEMTPTLTAIDRSVESHLVALAAEESRLDHGRPVRIS
ncbi:MAG: gfo/Idh/MocA family oxidoreductase, partial [Clostridia bacterium]|nr:gfo/Idh/MocA family oxidoreductase [Clostridia bacterium]